MPKTDTSRQDAAHNRKVNKPGYTIGSYSPKWQERHDKVIYGDNDLGLWGGESRTPKKK